MKKISHLILGSVFCIMNFSALYAQKRMEAADSLTTKIARYGSKVNSSVLFAHFDKTIYLNNESVWFTAYLLRYEKNINNPSVLSVLLVNDNDKSIAIDQKFAMSGGLGFGSVVIPDSIPPGNFTFIIYTNVIVNDKPANVFKQPITIKATTDLTVKTSLTLLDTANVAINGLRKVLLKTTAKNDQPLGKVSVTYHLGKNAPTTIKTDNAGQYLLSIPAAQIHEGNNRLEVTINYDKETRSVDMVLPVTERKYSVKFYPEGGNLVNATFSYIGWEVKNGDGKPIKSKGLLIIDNHVADTIETDNYGMGKFTLVPLMGRDYKVRLLGETKDTTYLLPRILSDGPVINLKQAVANDSLQVRMVSKYQRKYFVLVHNFHQIFFSFPVNVGAAGKPILMLLKNMPKGLATITVLDSLQRPVAERIFFSHYNERIPISIVTDKSVYTTRDKVHLRLKLNTTVGDSSKAIVSVACVQTNRLEIKKSNDIESYVYLKNELETLPLKENYMGHTPADQAFLENILLIKGWRRYTWQAMTQISSLDTVQNQKVITSYNGKIVHYGKRLKKPTQLIIMNDSLTNVIKTDQYGDFKLTGKSIMTTNDKKIRLVLGNNGNTGYSIILENPFININKLLIKDFMPRDYNFGTSGILNTSSQVLSGLEHAINLKEVKITGAKDDYNNQFQNLNDVEQSNRCGDYVCRNNILNCKFHKGAPDNRAPVAGKIYGIGDGTFTTIYKGCTVFESDQSSLSISGINYAKEFYPADYSQFNPAEPQYQSTIYWKYLCYLNSNKEVDLSFYTSDITGTYRIVVEGIVENGVSYNMKEFTVKKP